MKLLEFPQRVTTPLAQSETNPKETASILVVDDDAGILALIRRFLVNSGFSVEIASNGFAAWNALSNCRHDLLITDYNMPGMTGIELAEKVRDAQMSLPVVIVSGEVDGGILHDRPWLNLAAVLAKPFSPVELIALVNDTLTTAATDGSGNHHRRDGSQPGRLFESRRSLQDYPEATREQFDS